MSPPRSPLLGLLWAARALAALPAEEPHENATAQRLPHIFFVLVDDFGWAEVGYHRDPPTAEVRTPHIDALVREGVELNRHYVYMMCTPSRASFQSGRLPVHVITDLVGPCDENGAIPRNMTGLASVLKRAGYATHQVGKWDAGMSTPQHTPQGRGYDSSLTYFSHGNWMYSSKEWMGSCTQRSDMPSGEFTDLWDTDRPASHLNGTGYEEYLFRDRMLHILRGHNQSTPLFLQYDSRLVHYPLQVPASYQARFAWIPQENRRIYSAMVSFLDDQLANITGTMKELGMWENTLMVLSSDNGGYVLAEEGPCNTTGQGWPGSGPGTDYGHGTVCFNGEAGANNYPLRGGKYSFWEGGIRVNAFASGGFLPQAVRGTRLDGIIHIADWYRTFAEGIAGLDPTDHHAADSGLPPIDSLDVWPMLSGANLTSPRTSILASADVLIMGRWKYIRGGTSMVESARGGPLYPNASTAEDPIDAHSFRCPTQGCLFDVVADPTEERDRSAELPDVVAELKAELDRQAATIWSAPHGESPECRTAARERYGGFYGPWREVGPPPPLAGPGPRVAGAPVEYV